MKQILVQNGFEGYGEAKENNPFKNLPTPANDNEKTALQEQLEAEIDTLVYELYGLTDKEIKIVKAEIVEKINP